MSEFFDSLTEEQLKEIESYADKRVTDAVKTNSKKITAELTSQLTGEFEAKLETAISEAKAQAASNDEDKIASLQKMLDEQKAAFVKSQMEYKTEQKLREAGISKEAIESLTPIIVAGSNVNNLDSVLDIFVTTQKNAITSALEEQKKELASSYSQPLTGGGQQPPQSINSQFSAIMNQEGVDTHYAGAQAIQFLLDQANNS